MDMTEMKGEWDLTGHSRCQHDQKSESKEGT